MVSCGWGSPLQLSPRAVANSNLVGSQVLAITNTATSTFSTLLSDEGTSIPAFQTFFNYVLLNIIFTPYTMYRYGFKGWGKMVLRNGWKCECSLILRWLSFPLF